MPETVKDDSTTERIIVLCTCHSGLNIPNKGLGRAIAAAWRTRHEGDDASHDD